MSLINDYLKKSRAAKEDKSSSSAGVPPVMQQAKGGAAAPKERKVSPKTVVLLVIMILSGVGGYYMTMPPPAPSPQDYAESTDPGRESRSSLAPEAEEVSVGAQRRSEAAIKTELPEKNRLAERESGKRESQSAGGSTLTPESGLAQSDKKVSPSVLPGSGADANGPVNAVTDQTDSDEIGVPENISLDPASVKITSLPASCRESGVGFNETAPARVRRPNRKDDLDHLFQVGVLALNSENRSRALYYFNQVLELDHKHQDALLNLAVIYLSGNDFEKSRKLLEKAALNDPHDARVKVNQGLLALKSEDFDRAQRLFADALLFDPGSTPALNNLAWLAQQRGDRAAAFLYYRNLIALDPQNLDALLAYASCCEREKEYGRALHCYEEALQSRFLENDQPLERRIRGRIKLLADYME